MTMNEPTEELHRNLKKAAVTLKTSSVRLLSIVVRLSDVGADDEAQALMALVSNINKVENVLLACSQDVGAGVIVKAGIQ